MELVQQSPQNHSLSSNEKFMNIFKVELDKSLGEKAKQYYDKSFLQKIDQDLNIINNHLEGETVWIYLSPERLSGLGYKQKYHDSVSDYMDSLINNPDLYKQDIDYKCINKTDEETLNVYNILKSGNKKTYYIVSYKTYVKKMMSLRTEKANEMREYLYTLDVARTKFNRIMENEIKLKMLEEKKNTETLIEAEKEKSLILSKKLLEIEEVCNQTKQEKIRSDELVELSKKELFNMKKMRIDNILSQRNIDFPFTEHIYSAKETTTIYDATKVGKTQNIYARTATLNTSKIEPFVLKSFDVPFGLALNVEARLHFFLEPYRIDKEFFNFPEERVDKIIKKEIDNVRELYNLVKKECGEYNEEIIKNNSDEKLRERTQSFTNIPQKSSKPLPPLPQQNSSQHISKVLTIVSKTNSSVPKIRSAVPKVEIIVPGTCNGVFVSGEKKGKICGKPVKENHMKCGLHLSQEKQ